jgi:hypothetical protein
MRGKQLKLAIAIHRRNYIGVVIVIGFFLSVGLKAFDTPLSQSAIIEGLSPSYRSRSIWPLGFKEEVWRNKKAILRGWNYEAAKLLVDFSIKLLRERAFIKV